MKKFYFVVLLSLMAFSGYAQDIDFGLNAG